MAQQLNRRNFGLVSFLCLFLFASFPVVTKAENSTEQAFVIGVISSKPKKAFKRAQPLSDYLALNLKHLGYTHGEVKVARDLRELQRWLKNGQVDLFSETIFAAYQLEQVELAEIIARQWKDGAAEYHSIFFSRVDSNVSSFDDLVGKIIVFEDRLSTSAYLLPAATLIQQGYQLGEVSSPRERPQPGEIGYFFADELSRYGDESNMMSWVDNEIVAATAFSNQDWEKEITPEIESNLTIFYRTPDVPRALMLVRSSLDESLKKEIQQLLFSAETTEEGQEALKAFKKTTLFDTVTEESLRTIREIGATSSLIEH
ncbi:phosphate/phosphite/phosphonate ABC transporter substrate-binding protein [Vibrio maerlii]|uniref:phosphate/phosphite/phosphonate ABC transporter substrate-binding protein n=1 Tax=Vibrio maerlii TaxID=2231648 RepID=UPI000E3DBEBA|nr:phosphate/phosphite/phosphonate ABC transporter substrate-binding protein [Vibrio maerlii]